MCKGMLKDCERKLDGKILTIQLKTREQKYLNIEICDKILEK